MEAAATRNQIQRFIRTVHDAPFSALLLDYDGTLAPFSVNRQEAVPYPGIQPLLQEIRDTGRTRLVIITGRNASEIGPLLGIRPTPEIWGLHGMQHLRINGQSDMPVLDSKTKHALASAERWLAYQGLQHLAEPKPGSLAVHWRGLEETAATALRYKILLGWSALARSFSLAILEFDGGIELRMDAYDKGSAIRAILAEVGPDAPVAYLGDDATDEPAFRALNGRGLTALVREQRRQTSARVWLRPPAELRRFLMQWRDACRRLPSTGIDGLVQTITDSWSAYREQEEEASR